MPGDPWVLAARDAGYGDAGSNVPTGGSSGDAVDPWVQAAKDAGYGAVSPSGDTAPAGDHGSALQSAMPSPEIPRQTGIQNIPGNAALNGLDYGRGMAAAASLAALRGYEALPFVNDDRGGPQPLLRTFAYRLRPHDPTSPVIPADIDLGRSFEGVLHGNLDEVGKGITDSNLGKIGYGILESWDKHYTQPLLGHGLHPDIGAVADYWTQYPIDAATDLLPPLKLLRADALAGKIAKGIGSTGAAQKIAQAVKTAGTSALATEAATPVRNVITAAQDYLAQAKALAPFRQAITDDVKTSESELRPYWNALSNQDRAIAQDVAEGTHPRALAPDGLSPALQAYLSARHNLVQRMANRLLSMGLNSQKDLTWNEFLPYIMKKHGFARADLIAEADKPALLHDAIMDMAHAGFQPQYAPWMKEGEVAKVRRQAPWRLRGASPGDDAQPGFAKGRTAQRNDAHATNDFESLMARYTQIARYHHGYNKLLDGAIKFAAEIEARGGQLPPWLQQKIASGEWMQYSPRKLYEALAIETRALGEKEAMQAALSLPDQMFLPSPLAKALHGLSSGGNQSVRRILDGLNTLARISSVQRRYMLGSNPVFAETQSVQNILMLGLTQFRGVKDAFTTIMSYHLATLPEVQRAIPVMLTGEIAQNVGGTRYLSDIAQKFKAWKIGTPKGIGGRIANAFDNYVDHNLARMQAQDAAVRGVAAVYYALKLSEAEPRYGGAIKGMLTTGDAISRIKDVFSDAAHTERVAQDVIKVLGDFSQHADDGVLIQALKGVVLFPAWIKHIVNFTMALPQNHPYKWALQNKLYQVMPRFQDPNLPDWALRAGAVPVPGDVSPQGDQRFIMKSSLNPFTTVPELIELLGYVTGNDPAADPLVLSQMPLLFNLGALIATKHNPASNREFTDPSLIQYQGKQYKPEDIAAGRMIEQHPIPTIAEYILRNTLSAPTRAAERVLAAASGGEPSQFTRIVPSPLEGKWMPADPAIRNKTLPGGLQVPMSGPIDSPDPLRAAAQIADLVGQIGTNTRKIALDTNARQLQMIQQMRMYPNLLRAGIKQGKM